ncbi:MAG: glycosyltransferase [Proteobacteria bacterium]|nr:glycosyltransferase [Pseudomonadota bacterium]
MTVPEISVVCPFYREEDIVAGAAERLLSQMKQQFPARGWEIILVNDGSTDNSLEVLSEKLDAIGDTRVRVISYRRNQGRGYALKSGIDAARGSLIVTTEMDLSWGDDIVKRLVADLDAHPDAHFVVASPHASGGGLDAVPAMRQFLTRFGNRLISLFFDSGISMHTGMTRAYRRDVIQPLQVRERGKEFHLEVLLKLLTLGFVAREIPATISWRMRSQLTGKPRAKAKSSTSIRRTIATHMTFIAIAQPMRYFGFLSAVALAVASVMFGIGLVNFLSGRIAIFYILTAMFVALFGFLFFGFSIMFTHVREMAVHQWVRSYGTGLLPAAPLPVQAWPPATRE